MWYSNFTLYRLATILTLVIAINYVFAQTTQGFQHQIVTGAVVNFSDAVSRSVQQPGAGINNFFPIQPGNNYVRAQQANNGGGGSSWDSIETHLPSPAPLENFTAQYYDDYFPAYPHGAVNDSFVVSVCSYNLVVQSRAGLVLGQTNPYYLFYPAIPITYINQARLDYDPTINRWIIGCFCDQNTDTAGVLVGISQTANPMGKWNVFRIRADDAGAYYCYHPNLGFNKNWVGMAGYKIAIDSSGSTVDSEKIFLFDKAGLMNDTASAASLVVAATRMSIATTYDSTMENLYMLYEWSNTAGELWLTKISGVPGAESISTVAYPTSGVPYGGVPPVTNFEPQKGSTIGLFPDDDRPTNLVYMNGTLWCPQTVFLPAENPTRSSIQWWQIDTSGNILQLGLIDDTSGNLFFAYPSIAVNKDNDALIGYSVFSTQMYPSGGYSYHDHTLGAGTIDSAFVYAQGHNSIVDTNGGTNFWGEWSATVIDPLDNTGFWTLQAYASSTANQWQLQWANVNTSTTTIKAPQAAELSMRLFPNPNHGAFYLEVNGSVAGKAQLIILDLLGKEILTRELQLNESANVIPVSTNGLSAGMYLVEVSTADSKVVQRVVVE